MGQDLLVRRERDGVCGVGLRFLGGEERSYGLTRDSRSVFRVLGIGRKVVSMELEKLEMGWGRRGG